MGFSSIFNLSKRIFAPLGNVISHIGKVLEEKVLPLTRLKNLEATRLRQINASRRNSNQARQERIKSVEEKWKDPEYLKCAHAEGRSFFGVDGDWQKAWDGR